MFEKMRIKEHMEIVNSQGQHIGTVDEVDGDDIKLTKSDSSDNMHHRIPVDDVEKIDDNRICLKSTARIPAGINSTTAAL